MFYSSGEEHLEFVSNDGSFNRTHVDEFRIKMDYGEDVFQLEVATLRGIFPVSI